MVVTLKRLVILGFLLRLCLLCISNHIFYPDELYQTLEPAHRLVFGYGIETWDYRFHLRPILIPALLSLPLFATKLLHLDTPAIYLPLIKILLAAFSTLVIPAAYRLTKLITRSRESALLSAFFTATWYELIYFAPRPLTEVITTNLYAAAILSITAKKPRYLLTAMWITIAVLIRPQYVLLAISLLLFLIKQPLKKYLPWSLLGALFGMLMVGLADYWWYGRFLTSFITNYQLNFASGMSAVFGAQSPFLYGKELLITSGGLILLLLPAARKKPLRPLIYTIGGLILLHSLIPHKEYRFLYAVIPLYLTVLAIIFGSMKKRLQLALFCIISLLGLFHLLPGQSRVYQQSLTFTDPSHKLFERLSQDKSVCGVYDTTRQWVYAGGYTYLHQAVPIYDIDNPPSKQGSVSHIIALATNQDIPGFRQELTTPPFTVYYGGKPTFISGYALYAATTPCTNKERVEYYRSFPPVEDFIKAHQDLYHL